MAFRAFLPAKVLRHWLSFPEASPPRDDLRDPSFSVLQGCRRANKQFWFADEINVSWQCVQTNFPNGDRTQARQSRAITGSDRAAAESFPSISLESLLNVHEYRQHLAKRRKIEWMFRRGADRTFGLRDILGQKLKNTMSVPCNGMPRSATTWSFNMAMALLRTGTASNACKPDWKCDA